MKLSVASAQAVIADGVAEGFIVAFRGHGAGTSMPTTEEVRRTLPVEAA
jgi:hypothetical protein